MVRTFQGGGGRGQLGGGGVAALFGDEEPKPRPRILDGLKRTETEPAPRAPEPAACGCGHRRQCQGHSPAPVQVPPAAVHQDYMGNIIILTSPAAAHAHAPAAAQPTVVQLPVYPPPAATPNQFFQVLPPTTASAMSRVASTLPPVAEIQQQQQPTQKCQNCLNIQSRNRSMDNSDLLGPSSKGDDLFSSPAPPGGGGGYGRGNLRTSNSEGFLSSSDRETTGDLSKELEGTLNRLQETVTRHEDHGYASDLDNLGRKSFSAPNGDSGSQSQLQQGRRSHGHQDDLGFGSASSGGDGGLFDGPGAGLGKQQAGRRQRGQTTKSGYRRELQAQMDEQQARRDREKEEDRYGIADPMQHLHRSGSRSGGGPGGGGGADGSYSPSLFDHSPRRGATKAERDAYKRDLVLQMQADRSRKEAEKASDTRDWWEKREQIKPEPPAAAPKKPHPSQARKKKAEAFTI